MFTKQTFLNHFFIGKYFLKKYQKFGLISDRNISGKPWQSINVKFNSDNLTKTYSLANKVSSVKKFNNIDNEIVEILSINWNKVFLLRKMIEFSRIE